MATQVDIKDHINPNVHNWPDDARREFAKIRASGLTTETYTLVEYTPTFACVEPRLSGGALAQPSFGSGGSIVGYYAKAWGWAHVHIYLNLGAYLSADVGHGSWAFGLPSAALPKFDTIAWSGSAALLNPNSFTAVKAQNLTAVVPVGETYMVFPGISQPGYFGGDNTGGSSVGLTELFEARDDLQVLAAISYPVDG